MFIVCDVDIDIRLDYLIIDKSVVTVLVNTMHARFRCLIFGGVGYDNNF